MVRGKLISTFAVIVTVTLPSCGSNKIGGRIEIRSSQVNEIQLLDRADLVVIGRVLSIAPLGQEYASLDDLGREARHRQVMVSVEELAVVRDETDLWRKERPKEFEFLYIEDRGMRGTSGPEKGVAKGLSIIPVRRENGHWRSVVDLWPPVLPISAIESELQFAENSEISTIALRRLLLSVPIGKNRWPIVANSASILSHFFGPVEAVNDLRQLLRNSGDSSCSICLHLASHFPGQYECLNRMLLDGLCDADYRKRALSILAGTKHEQRLLAAALRSRKLDHWVIRSNARNLAEALGLLSMHNNAEVRAEARKLRSAIEGSDLLPEN